MIELIDAIQQMSARIDARFDRLELRFDSVEARLDRVEARLDRVEARLDSLEARFDSLEARFDSLEARFGDLESRFGALESRVDGFERFVKSQPDLKLILLHQRAIVDELRGMRQDIIMVKSATYDFSRVSVTEGEINALHEAVNEATERSYLLAARMDAWEQAHKTET